ncbi:MAG: extracellular solute-binding protein [Bacilli bacterium]|nr:extracellular solute-binding protein [Bacilli bacterium]
MANFITSALMFATLVVPSAVKEAKFFAPTRAADIGSGSQTLRLLNVEDYIYEKDPEDEGAAKNLVHQFEDYARDLGYTNVKVSYATTDTPESMFNELKISADNFDLICPSDYMIQKLIVNNMLEPMNIDAEHMPNYFQNASSIKDRLDAISAVNATTKQECFLKDYAVGYMWGTLGILFDPTYGGRDAEKTIEDMQKWDVLWDPDYKGISSIKDSVRDTYAIGLLHAYDKEFTALIDSYNKGEITAEKYNEEFSELFNSCDDATLEKVRKSLSKLKGNVFGMEVDSGKQDIVTGKIGINFAWSGDAVYSMEQAETEKELELYYSIPNTGSNLWMDAWCMPKSSQRSEAQKELAELFLDFLSIPEITAQNMDYTGYTPFTGGNEILDLTREWYDIRYDEETETFDDAIPTTDEIAEKGLQKVDLSYFFAGTITDENGVLLTGEDEKAACTFYTDCYLSNATTDAEGNITGGNRAVGRAFFCQFPDENTLARCAVMRDFGTQNEAVLKMWEKFKTDTLPVWAIVLFVVEISLFVAFGLYHFVGKRVKYKLRKKRKEEANKK